MGKHYISQFYLRLFSENPDSADEWYINVYPKNGSEPYRTNIKNIAQEGDYFTNETEVFLAQTIEGPTKSVIDKINRKESISLADKRILSDYMSVLVKSNLRARTRIIESFDKNNEEFCNDVVQRLLDTINNDPQKQTEVEELIDQIRQFQREDNIKPKDVWENFLRPEIDSLISDVIYNMTWLFLNTKTPIFLTSDNPIFFFEHIGVGKLNSEITFPISPQITLWCTWRYEIDRSYPTISNKPIHEINRRTLDFAYKNIYSTKEELWIRESLKRAKYRLNILNLKINYRNTK